MSELRKLTRLGGDVRKIAALLQSKGRGRDTILAHITPREAALLKARGGRGSTNPDTGLLEFEDDAGAIEDYRTSEQGQGADQQSVGSAPPWAMNTSGLDQAYIDVAKSALPTEGVAPEPIVPQPATPSFRPSQTYGPGMTGGETAAYDLATQAAAAPPPAAPGLVQRAADLTGLSQDQLGKALGVGLQGLSSALLTRRAQREAQAGKQEISQLGAPYRAKAQELMAQAQSGQLSPVGQQAIEAARARLAQQATARGGVGAAQMATQLEAFRQQLLQQQYDLGLKLSGVADQFALRAIQQGLTADQQVNQLLGQAMGNIGAIFAGTAQPQVPGGR